MKISPEPDHSALVDLDWIVSQATLPRTEEDWKYKETSGNKTLNSDLILIAVKINVFQV